jgi:hypothetical protein
VGHRRRVDSAEIEQSPGELARREPEFVRIDEQRPPSARPKARVTIEFAQHQLAPFPPGGGCAADVSVGVGSGQGDRDSLAGDPDLADDVGEADEHHLCGRRPRAG